MTGRPWASPLTDLLPAAETTDFHHPIAASGGRSRVTVVMPTPLRPPTAETTLAGVDPPVDRHATATVAAMDGTRDTLDGTTAAMAETNHPRGLSRVGTQEVIRELIFGAIPEVTPGAKATGATPETATGVVGTTTVATAGGRSLLRDLAATCGTSFHSDPPGSSPRRRQPSGQKRPPCASQTTARSLSSDGRTGAMRRWWSVASKTWACK